MLELRNYCANNSDNSDISSFKKFWEDKSARERVEWENKITEEQREKYQQAIEIVNKYKMRGFGIVINEREKTCSYNNLLKMLY